MPSCPFSPVHAPRSMLSHFEHSHARVCGVNNVHAPLWSNDHPCRFRVGHLLLQGGFCLHSRKEMYIMVPILTGTLPIRPYHPTQLFGAIKADGQLPKVAALACHQQELVAISLVGYDTSISAALARLWQREQLAFEPDPAIDWHGPGHLDRRQEHYKQFHATLPGTKEVHCLALPVSAHIAEGILHPPDVPKPQQEQGPSSPAMQQAQADRSRFVLGNWDEEAPYVRSFLGHLHAMRVIFLHRHENPALVEAWATQLWIQGLARKLITPLQALGIKAWKLTGDLTLWSHLIGEGVRSGWLPWNEEVQLTQEIFVS